MRSQFNIYLLLSVLLIILTHGGLAVADNAQRMAEMQKALNEEVLAQPFSVAERKERRPAAEQTQTRQVAPRRIKPRLHLGWHSGYPFHGHRWHHGFYHGLHSHRYRYH